MGAQEISPQAQAKSNHGKFVHQARVCPQYHQAVELIGRRWMGAILFALMEGPRRFHEIEEMIPGISHRLLTERLRELEEQGIVLRRVIVTSPVKVEYELTEAGLDLQEAVAAIMNWGEKWLPSSTLQQKQHGSKDPLYQERESSL
ncbi:helix-turn-helix transcriptional regulator [Ktedonobacteria bacterium brp13]|nr:helix-turn-helix transcriptional regulator [Ktedonobacteria bacterium brp13]